MLHLAGIRVTDTDALQLVAKLTARGGPGAVDAATIIGKGIENDGYTVGFTPAMSDAILSVLTQPPDGLVELRTKLSYDRASRTV